MRVPQSAFFPGTSFANGAVCVLQRFPVWIFFFWTCLTRPSAPRVLLQVGVWSASGLGPGFLGVAGSRGAGVGGAFCLSFCWPQQPPEIGTVQVCSGVAQRREASPCPRPCLWPPSLKASSEQRCLPPEEEAAGAPPDAEQAVPGATGRGHRGCSPGGGSQQPHGLGECPTGRSGTSAGCGPRPPPPDGMAPAIA